MNVHHLELFYYVARHGGVSAAARAMPYGIQQPAISAQILQLEDSLGTTLFHRRPFRLTGTGEALDLQTFKLVDQISGRRWASMRATCGVVSARNPIMRPES